ncbi:hypothetical protein PENANT_c005G07009 [Penicillium antarcticum]|uniref:Uncharacterized protein n=1 Tax=Penicillium antarcticum TaxID=416450 RepID=A0A1V6QEL9_9EURO|nr:uncharacterized protein N7508_007956 [Penicillium antarcticum]KAJ5297707.1 hypothetical protein N7508_007956 [Penicillium antarcticum]OQD87670.1 hypothetical protein PENANT_c005G07009 [Penicillium antarcticum]
MKASFIAAVAAMAGSAFAAPTPTNGLESLLDNLHIGDIFSELHLNELPKVLTAGELAKAVNKPMPSASAVPAVQDGHIVQNLGPQLDNILTVTGPDVGTLLIELSPEVTALVSGLGLPGLGVPLGSIVASASGLGGLVTALGKPVDGLVTVVGADVGALLIELSAPVAALVSGLGLPGVGVPLGTVVATVGKNLKRGEIVNDVAPSVKSTLTVTGANAKQLLLELSPEVTALVSGLGLGSIAGPVGSIIKEAASVGDLLKDVSEPVDQLLHVVNDDGKHLLIKLSPSVAALVAGLGLPQVGTPVGTIVATVGNNL